ncbi:MAG: CHRD domain-containing protein [SAR324 cluster bacterium]|nr:CHRD domain-containing protein [SAR324 cluster bacterium]
MQSMKTFLITTGLIIFGALIFTACSEDHDRYDSEGTLYFDKVELSSKNEVPETSEKYVTGTANIVLAKNNVTFNLKIYNVPADDSLTTAHIHIGEPDETGGVLVTLVDGDGISFDEDNEAVGTVSVKDIIVNQLKDEDVSLYVNVHSDGHPAGLVRATLRHEE